MANFLQPVFAAIQRWHLGWHSELKQFEDLPPSQAEPEQEGTKVDSPSHGPGRASGPAGVKGRPGYPCAGPMCSPERSAFQSRRKVVGRVMT